MDWKYLFTSFQGRINRAKFWAGVGVMIGISIVLSLIDALLGLQIGTGDGAIGILRHLDVFPIFRRCPTGDL